MATEILIFSSLSLLYYKNIIGWKIILVSAWICYWIPKFLIVHNGLNRFYPLVLTHNSHQKDIALTFDDVPYDNQNIGSSFEKILDVLDKYNMKATFFMISDYVTSQNEHLLIRAIKTGHQIGNHGKTNSLHVIKSLDALEKEIDACDFKIRQLYEKANVPLPKTMVYRPGCGLFTQKMINLIEKKNYKLTLGSVYPNDTFMMSGIINYYYLINHIQKGDIVIMHDRGWTPGLLEWLLPWCKKNNYQSVTVNDIIG